MDGCFIALGGNVGPVEQTFQRALELLASCGEISILQVSSIYKTSAIGPQAGSEFTNAAAELETSLSAIQLLAELQNVENQLGRARTVHWGPRTLDLDLILFGDEIISLPQLIVPHPACWYRRFVLDPLVEIAAEKIHPVTKLTIRDLHDRLLVRPLTCSITADDEQQTSAWIKTLTDQFPEVEFIASNNESTLLFDHSGPKRLLLGRSVIRVPQGVEDPLLFMQTILKAALGN